MKINTNKQLRAVRNELRKLAVTKMAKIVVGSDGVWFDMTTTVENNLELEIVPSFVMSGKTQLWVENFTDTIVSVEFKTTGSPVQKKIVMDRARLYEFVAIRLDGRKSSCIAIVAMPGGKIMGLDVVSGDSFETTISELKSQGYSLYISGPYSTAEARKNGTTLYKCESSVELVEKLDRLTYGQSSIVLNGEMVTQKKSQQASSRFGIWKTGMSHREPSNLTVAIHCGKWSIDGTQHADGKGFLRAEKLAEVLSSDRFDVTPHAVTGIFVQCRPFANFKLLAKVTESETISAKIEFDADTPPIWINRQNVTPEILEEFNKLFKGGESRFSGRIVIIKDYNTPEDLKAVDLYSDLNGLKAPFNMSLDSGFNILAIDKPTSDGKVNTNVQQLETLAKIDPELFKETMLQIGSGYNKSCYHGVFASEAKIPSVLDMESLYLTGITKSIAPEFLLQNRKMFGQVATQSVQSQEKALDRLNYPIAGGSRLLGMDFGADFGVKILPAGTCYVPGIKDRNILATRNPKNYSGEFLMLKNLKYREVAKLVDGSSLTGFQKKLVKQEYRLLSTSAAIIPAFEEYKQATGGADVDGDTLTIVAYRKFTQLVLKGIKSGTIRPTAIRVKNEAPKQDASVKMNLRSVHGAFCRLISSGNLSVGEVTFISNFIFGLYLDVKAGKFEAATEFFSWAKNRGSNEYVPLERKFDAVLGMAVVDINFETAEAVNAAVKSMILNKENMLNALDDMVLIFTMIQMETIDSPKTGLIVKVLFEDLLDDFVQASKTDINFSLALNKHEEFDANEGWLTFEGIKYKLENRSGWEKVSEDSEGDPVKKYFHQDFFQDVRKGIAREILVNAVNLKRRYGAVKYGEEATNFFTVAETRNKKLVRSIVELKMLYNSVNAGASEETDEASHYRTYLAALANTIRLVTPGMDAVERAALLEAVSMPREGSSHSSFAFSTCKEEYLAMIIEHFAQVDFAGEMLMYSKNVAVGDILEFVAGNASDGDKVASTKSSVTGTFEIKEHKGRLYASRDLRSFVPAVSVTDEVVFRAIPAKGITMEAFKDALLGAANVMLKIEYGKGGDMVIADGKHVGKFITVPGKEGELNKVYNGRSGSVKNFMIVEEKTSKGTKDVLVGILS